MKKLSNSEAELKKSVAYKNNRVKYYNTVDSLNNSTYKGSRKIYKKQ